MPSVGCPTGTDAIGRLITHQATVEMNQLNCLEVMEQLEDYLDEDAREELCRAIEGHLKNCSTCRFKVDSTRKTIVLYQADREIEMPAAVSQSLQAALAKEYTAKGDD